MPRNDRLTPDGLLQGLIALSIPGAEPVSSSQLATVVGSSLPAVERLLPGLIAEGRVEVNRQGPRHAVPAGLDVGPPAPPTRVPSRSRGGAREAWSFASACS
ncbi:hypothetical protein [Roseateles aquatilis]|uniref:hypothetical protein n=1 Tax=Roseateles aquatilis TaxID=431061 RepID=UPI001130B750|nr:hypothetical protein [Roseateles aquatilis]